MVNGEMVHTRAEPLYQVLAGHIKAIESGGKASVYDSLSCLCRLLPKKGLQAVLNVSSSTEDKLVMFVTAPDGKGIVNVVPSLTAGFRLEMPVPCPKVEQVLFILSYFLRSPTWRAYDGVWHTDIRDRLALVQDETVSEV